MRTLYSIRSDFASPHAFEPKCAPENARVLDDTMHRPCSILVSASSKQCCIASLLSLAIIGCSNVEPDQPPTTIIDLDMGMPSHNGADLGTPADSHTHDATMTSTHDMARERDTSPVFDMSKDNPDASDMETWQLPNMEAFQAAIEQDITNNHATAASVSIWYKDRIIWLGGFGSIPSPNGARRPDEQTMFMLGSNTKPIAAAAYLQQIERGQTRLDTTPGEVFPSLRFPSAQSFTETTAHELMTHQGGINDDLGLLTTMTSDDALRTFAFTQFPQRVYELAPPGLFHNYSNPNYIMLGLMTEHLGGAYWADLVEQDLMQPLEMTRSVARKSSVDLNHAAGVGRKNLDTQHIAPVSLEDTWEDAFARPATLIWSTPSDQMRFARFLVKGDETILSDELRQLITSPQTSIYPDIPGDYGYGMVISEGITLGDGYHKTPVWWHNGNTLTHSSTLYILPEQEFALAILSNGTGDNFRESVSVAIQTLVQDLPTAVEREMPSVDPTQLDDLTGRYIDPSMVGRIDISRQGDRLRIDMPDLNAARIDYEPILEPISTRYWVVTVQGQPVYLAFFDGDGQDIYIVSRAFVARRSSDRITGITRLPSPTYESIDAALNTLERTSSTSLLFPWKH